jgi:NADPH:quinone reductase-like Zn-dependent oxidoreductase
MRAVLCERYGEPRDALKLRTVDKPTPNDDEVLVRVRASSVNPAEWYTVTGPLLIRGMSGLRRPKEARIGTDYAGTVEAVGQNVTEFKPGDDVFGGRAGAYADYVCARADRGIALKPTNVSFEEAGVVAIAGMTALQGLRDKGNVKPGDKVLVNGASGGVGTFAVQVAKALGAEVTGVCSTRNVEQTRSLGADRVIDYTQENFTRGPERYDVLFDVASAHPWAEFRRVLKPNGIHVLVGASKHSKMFGPLVQIARMFIASKLRRGPKLVFFIAKIDKEGMNAMRELIESGKVKPVIDRAYPLDQIADAFDYLGEGHARAKVAVTI